MLSSYTGSSHISTNWVNSGYISTHSVMVFAVRYTATFLFKGWSFIGSPIMPGNLNLRESQIKILGSDLNIAFEMAIGDRMDNLLSLQTKGSVLQNEEVYEEPSNLQYFKHLASIPTLSLAAPNFLQASDVDSCQNPHACLHSEGSEDGQLITADEVLLDLRTEERRSQQQAPHQILEDVRFAKKRLIAEAIFIPIAY
ncbi:unnamed protein product [Cylicocyclus nassatus]|uniref:Uncharacterized protein n=1 Tax=Cylicocyclus nassatus TaxID=53992 RepID=A0AA36GW87_CYLNA|nr:unnamed protein product [Cylicocyclus nassatus]